MDNYRQRRLWRSGRALTEEERPIHQQKPHETLPHVDVLLNCAARLCLRQIANCLAHEVCRIRIDNAWKHAIVILRLTVLHRMKSDARSVRRIKGLNAK